MQPDEIISSLKDEVSEEFNQKMKLKKELQQCQEENKKLRDTIMEMLIKYPSIIRTNPFYNPSDKI